MNKTSPHDLIVTDILKTFWCYKCPAISAKLSVYSSPDIIALCHGHTIGIEVKSSYMSMMGVHKKQNEILEEWARHGAEIYIAVPCKLFNINTDKKGDCNYAYYMCLLKLRDYLMKVMNPIHISRLLRENNTK